jgi:outer membrane protein assembly factor BamB
VASAAAAEWPGFRGPRRDGVVTGVRIATDWTATPPVELWRRPIGPGWSSFAVQGDRIYTQEQRGEDEVVACYERATGRPIWAHRDPVRFFEANGGAGPRATPALAGGRVYTFGATGILNALEAADGRRLWSRNVPEDTGAKVPIWGFSSSPLVVAGEVMVAAAGQLVAYDAATGEKRWVGAAGLGYSSPQLLTLDGVPQVVMVSHTGTTAVAPADGAVLWQHPWRGNPIVQPAAAGEHDLLVAASSDSGTRRLGIARGANGWTVQERWTSPGLKPYFNDFVVHQGHAYGFDARILSCIDLADGQRKWKGGRYGNGQLLLLSDQDVLLVLSEEGELALVAAKPDQFTELARFKAIEGKTWNHPVLVGDVVLVRNGEEMAAFRLPRADR